MRYPQLTRDDRVDIALALRTYTEGMSDLQWSKKYQDLADKMLGVKE